MKILVTGGAGYIGGTVMQDVVGWRACSDGVGQPLS